MRSAWNPSRPGRLLKRRSSIATSSRQSMPSILKVDSACSSQTVQVAAAMSALRPGQVDALVRARADVLVATRGQGGHRLAFLLLDALVRLRKEPDHVVIVQGVEHH